MEFQLGDKLLLAVTKHKGFPRLKFTNCVINNGKIILTRECIHIILSQYAKLKQFCGELLNHDDPNQPLEKELGYGVTARNKLCMSKDGKKVRKIVLFNDKTCGAFEIDMDAFNSWREHQVVIEQEIQNVKSEITAEKQPKKEDVKPIDFTCGNIMSIENAFTHLCALLARRAVKPCFPCVACHNNMPWESSSNHTCAIDEKADLDQKAMPEIIKLMKSPEMLREKFSEILKTNHPPYVLYLDVLFETFFCAFLKTFSGRSLIYDIVNTSVSAAFCGFNPQSSLMYDIAYIVLDEHEFNALPFEVYV